MTDNIQNFGESRDMAAVYNEQNTNDLQARRPDNGLYIAVEGLDGAGKTTLATQLADKLGGHYTMEPGSQQWTGETAREALQRDTAPVTDTMLFAADRSEHLENVVLPLMAEDEVVVSDRSALSTYAYQAESLSEVMDDPWDYLDSVYENWDVRPDVTILVQVTPETAVERSSGGDKHEKYKFLKGVYDNYQLLIEQERRGPVISIDGEMDSGYVLQNTLERLNNSPVSTSR